MEAAKKLPAATATGASIWWGACDAALQAWCAPWRGQRRDGQSPTRPIGLLRVGQKVPRKAGLTAISRRVPAPPHPVGGTAGGARNASSVFSPVQN